MTRRPAIEGGNVQHGRFRFEPDQLTREDAVAERMSREDKRRSLMFRVRYWERTLEIIPLMLASDRPQVLRVARQNLGRREFKPVQAASEANPDGPLSKEHIDAVAKRYALWSVRKAFDWDQYPDGFDQRSLMINETLLRGVWELDVEIRRELESMLLQGLHDPGEAASIRNRVATTAKAMTGELAARTFVEWERDDWDYVAKYLDEILQELSFLLGLVDPGPPR